MTLQNNGGDDLVVSVDGGFSFPTPLTNGQAYLVSVTAQPVGQTCTVSSGSGSIAAADVNDVVVSCVDTPFSVGGSISGLVGSVTLQNNGGDDLIISAAGGFNFPSPLTNGQAYLVSVSVQPAGQTCTVSSGSGSIAAADVSDVVVACVDNASAPTPPGPSPSSAPPSAEPIPSMPTWALALMIGFLVWIGYSRVRKV